MREPLIGECAKHPGNNMVRCSMCAIERFASAPTPTEIDSLLCEVAQLLDGWKADGTAWTPWDQSIRDRVTDIRARLSTAK